jgi:hypothetical protein
MTSSTPIMKTFLDWTKQSLDLFSVILGFILVIWALFAHKLPIDLRWHLSTTVGRLLLLLLLYITYMLSSWPITLLFAIAIAFTWASRPVFEPTSFTQSMEDELSTTEGFQNIKRTPASKHKWFIEKTLHENPQAIVEDRIDTSAVEEDTVVATGRTSK